MDIHNVSSPKCLPERSDCCRLHCRASGFHVSGTETDVFTVGIKYSIQSAPLHGSVRCRNTYTHIRTVRSLFANLLNGLRRRGSGRAKLFLELGIRFVCARRVHNISMRIVCIGAKLWKLDLCAELMLNGGEPRQIEKHKSNIGT